MRLEVGSFPVNDVVFGSETAWRNGVLELDQELLLAPVVAEPSVLDAKLEIARPGESARIINHFDILEPRVKVSGPGTVYPGRAGRPVDTVGQGRTHRLDGVTLVVSYDGAYDRWGSNAPAGYLTSPVAPKWFDTHDKIELPREDRRQEWSNHHFIDMSGPGAVLPLASTINISLSLGLTDGLDIQNKASLCNSIGLKLQDTLAETVRDLDPPDLEEFDLSVQDPSLPGMVFVWMLSSPEGTHGPQSVHGAGIYGHTRLSAPWLLWPTEVMDGAITGGGRGHGTWDLTNNPIVMGLSRRHGKSLNFLSCIVLREPWFSEEEMQFVGNRAAEAAKQLGAQGAIVTNEVRGLQFVSSARTIQAIEQGGIKTVWVSEEEDNEGGTVPPFLYHPPEMEAVVSTGTGAAGPFPPVERVLGSTEGAVPEWYGEQPAVPGRYGVEHVLDHYGFGKQYCVDY